MTDLVLRNVRLPDHLSAVDILIGGGRIEAIGPGLGDGVAAPVQEGGGALASPGLVETHIHLDKAGILHRCSLCHGTLAEAVSETARAKAAFTEADVYARAEAVLRAAISHGTTRMRSFVEIDPRAGFRSLDALLHLRADYAHAITLELCAFAQEGLTNEPETYAMLDAALARGADLVGGCPYTDPDPERHVSMIFDLARKYDVAVDFHLDFDLDAAGSNIPHVLRETEARGWGGRTSIGHVTKLSAMAPGEAEAQCQRLASAGIALTVLPATDLFLMGRDTEQLSPRGMFAAHRQAGTGLLATLSTNNVLNPFTPFGDVSLIRMANLYANIAQAGTPGEMTAIHGMITTQAARLLGAPDPTLVRGAVADIVLLDAESPAMAVATVAPALWGCKEGRPTFARAKPTLFDLS